MSVLEPAGRLFDEVDRLGVVIRRIGENLHTGILYRLGDEPARIVHLAFHHDLRDETPTPSYRWAEMGLDDVNKAVVAALASRIAGSGTPIPYGFNNQGLAFDTATGDMLPAPPGVGLTCATFITAVLRTYALEPVEIDTWPSRDDDVDFHEWILELLRNGASPEHTTIVEQDTEAKRLRPDEAVAAVNVDCDRWPVKFPEARNNADIVQSCL